MSTQETAATFDPAAVRIERHRASVTQGEVSVSYRGELIARFGDDIHLCDCPDGTPDHGGAAIIGGWHGRDDRYWLDAAAAWSAKRAGAAPAADAPAAPATVAEVVATRATMHEARRHFEAGGAVLVHERGDKPTVTVHRTTTTHDRTRTTWDELAAMVKMWRNRYPNQRFYVVPAPDQVEPAADAEPAGRVMTVKQLQGTRGARVLITDEREHAGGGAGTWRAARVARRPSWATSAGEPVGIHAATVERVEYAPDADGTRARYNVVTNLGTVEHVTAGQAFRIAPADMRDSTDIRAELRAARAESEAREAYNRENPRDADGVNVHPGELVELLDVNNGRPYTVVRAIRAYGVVGGLLVARPYERAYGDNPAGTGLALNFRRLADQGDGPTVRRSCGCPATVRDAILPAPADGVDAWGAAIRHIDEMAAEDRQHREGCTWAGGPTVDADGQPVTAGDLVELIGPRDALPYLVGEVTAVDPGAVRVPGYGRDEASTAPAHLVRRIDGDPSARTVRRSCGCPAEIGEPADGHAEGCTPRAAQERAAGATAGYVYIPAEDPDRHAGDYDDAGDPRDGDGDEDDDQAAAADAAPFVSGWAALALAGK